MDATQLHSNIFIQQSILLVLMNEADEKRRKSKDKRTQNKRFAFGYLCKQPWMWMWMFKAKAKLQRLQSQCPAEPNTRDPHAK
jgi:hypothetical protein